MYGYGKSWGTGKGSLSGWEKSHFGGFKRVLNDYPFVDLSYKVDLSVANEVKEDLGFYLGEKLLKIYILKLRDNGFLDELPCEIIEKSSYFGTTVKRYSSISLNHLEVFDSICSRYIELAPLFREYKEGILSSTIDFEIPQDQGGDGEGKGEKQEGEGKGEKKEGDGEGEGEDEGEGEGNGEGEGKGEKKEGDVEGDGEGDGEGEGEGEGKKGGKKPGGKKPNGRKKGAGEGVDPRTILGKEGKSLMDHLRNIEERKPVTYSKSLSKFSKEAKFVTFTERIKIDKPDPYHFERVEKTIAENLVKMLDISFDPKSDVVKNLKLGKLDTSKIAEVPAGNMSIYKQIVEEQDTKPFSVCILADMSGSMCQGRRVSSQLTLLNALYLAMREILPEDKLFIYGHSGDYEPEIFTFYTPYDTDYERNIQYYSRVRWCENYDGPVIEKIHKSIREKTEDRIIFISLSDGMPCGSGYGGTEDNEDLKRIIEKTRRDSFVTVGIGIEADHVEELYQYSKSVFNLTNIAKEASSLINRVVRQEFQ